MNYSLTFVQPQASFSHLQCSLSSHAGVALSICRKAVQICDAFAPSLSRSPNVYNKSDSSPVTCVDFAVQVLTSEKLRETRSGNLVAEEDMADFEELSDDMKATIVDLAGMEDIHSVRNALQSARSSGEDFTVWSCDPIDGSKGLLSGCSFAVGLAKFTENGEILTVAALALPAVDVDKILLVDDRRLSILPARITDGEGSDTSIEEGDLDITRNAADIGSNARDAKFDASRIDDSTIWYFSPASGKVRLPGLPPARDLQGLKFCKVCCGSLVKYGNVALRRAAALVQSVPSGEVHVRITLQEWPRSSPAVDGSPIFTGILWCLGLARAMTTKFSSSPLGLLLRVQA